MNVLKITGISIQYPYTYIHTHIYKYTLDIMQKFKPHQCKDAYNEDTSFWSKHRIMMCQNFSIPSHSTNPVKYFLCFIL